MDERDEVKAEIAQDLLAVLERQAGYPRLRYSAPLTPLAGGYSSALFSFELDAAPPSLVGPLVLRLMHDDAAARRETAIHTTVAILGFPAPTVRVSGDSTEGFGRPFIVMDRVAGRVAVQPDKPWTLPGTLRRLPALLADTAAELHSIDPEPVIVAVEAAGHPVDRLGADAVLDELEAAIELLDRVDLGSALSWLQAHRPPRHRRAVCHGDLHGLNLLLHDGQLAAVVDWELSTVEDPMFDVARTSMILWALPGEMSSLARRILTRLSDRLSRRFEDSYAGRHDFDRQSFAWYQALHCLRTITRVVASDAGTAAMASAAVADAWRPTLPAIVSRLHDLTTVS